MGASRALGALLCVVCIVIAALYVGFLFGGYLNTWIFQSYTAPLWIVLPVVVGVLVLAGLGTWLGWIMATTKEVAPAPVATETPEKKRE